MNPETLPADPSAELPAAKKSKKAKPGLEWHPDPVLEPEVIRSDAAAKITELALSLKGRDGDARATWIKIGERLLAARNSFSGQIEFGAWIKRTGLDKTPGLTAPASRSDAIWCAEYPDCVGLVPEEAVHPRVIRQCWRRLYQSCIREQADLLVEADVTPQETGKIADAAGIIATETLCDEGDAYEDLLRLISDIASGAVDADEMNKALLKLRRAMEEAAGSGVTSQMLCMNAGAVWGGFFTWSHQQAKPPQTIEEAIAAAKADGVKMTALLAIISEAYE